MKDKYYVYIKCFYHAIFKSFFINKEQLFHFHYFNLTNKKNKNHLGFLTKFKIQQKHNLRKLIKNLPHKKIWYKLLQKKWKENLENLSFYFI